jgi:hypothetical protein
MATDAIAVENLCLDGLPGGRFLRESGGAAGNKQNEKRFGFHENSPQSDVQQDSQITWKKQASYPS